MLTALLDVLYPPRCLVCRVGSHPLCARCRLGFRPVPSPICARCGRPRAAGADPQREHVATPCPRCRAHPPAFAAARAVGTFDGALRIAVHRLKFDGRRALAPALGGTLAAFVADHAELHAHIVVPVPLHARRLARRGFNQAALLARPVAEALGRPLIERLLLRTRRTVPQTGLGREARAANVGGAFALAPGAAPLRGLTVLLVDDVLTSGATAEACAAALRAGGAARVAVAALAVAADDRDGARTRRPLP